MDAAEVFAYSWMLMKNLSRGIFARFAAASMMRALAW